MTQLHTRTQRSARQSIAPTTVSEEDDGVISLRLVDAAYFRKNPLHTSYTREPSKSELKAHPGCIVVRVLSLVEGAESRIKIFEPLGQVEPDGDHKLGIAYAAAVIEKMPGVTR